MPFYQQVCPQSKPLTCFFLQHVQGYNRVYSGWHQHYCPDFIVPKQEREASFSLALQASFPCPATCPSSRLEFLGRIKHNLYRFLLRSYTSDIEVTAADSHISFLLGEFCRWCRILNYNCLAELQHEIFIFIALYSYWQLSIGERR